MTYLEYVIDNARALESFPKSEDEKLGFEMEGKGYIIDREKQTIVSATFRVDRTGMAIGFTREGKTTLGFSLSNRACEALAHLLLRRLGELEDTLEKE